MILTFFDIEEVEEDIAIICDICYHIYSLFINKNPLIFIVTDLMRRD
ncbi:MAG TPA: hypothetical protein PK566_13885 [Pseudobacteroides sp.]|nr:hypothetical protein [Pseudobacteroides sp.]